MLYRKLGRTGLEVSIFILILRGSVRFAHQRLRLMAKSKYLLWELAAGILVI